jgi:endo-1,3(4)-beta-glucanase
VSAPPFDTSTVFYPSVSLKLSASATLAPQSTGASPSASGNIFVPIASNAPPAQISLRSDHPANATGITAQNSPLYTNKFYANLFLGEQGSPVWTHPYSVMWARGGGSTESWGLSVSHLERSMLAYGGIYAPSGAPQFFVNPGMSS